MGLKYRPGNNDDMIAIYILLAISIILSVLVIAKGVGVSNDYNDSIICYENGEVILSAEGVHVGYATSGNYSIRYPDGGESFVPVLSCYATEGD